MAEKSSRKKPGTAKKTRPKPGAKKKHFDVYFYHDWCKACGICMAFCPQEIIKTDRTGKPVIEEADRCVGCRFCEVHCPDFAITVTERKPKRRKNDV